MHFVRSLFVVVVTYVVTASTKDQSPEVFDVLNNYRRDIESPRQIVTMSLILPDRETETVTHFTTVVSTVPQTFSLPTRQTVMQLTTLTSTITCTKSVANKCVRQRPSSSQTNIFQRPTTRPTRPAAVRPALSSVPASAVEIVAEVTEAQRDSHQPSKGKNQPEQPAKPELVSSIQEVVMDEEVNDILVEAVSDEHEQFPIISPSAIQTVHPTELPHYKPRDGRVADPQLLVVYDTQPQDIESGFISGPYHPVIMPFSRRYRNPDLPVNRQRYGDGGNQQQRQFLQYLFTITRRSTVLEIDIFTVTPTCAESGRIPQCPREKKRTSIKKISATIEKTTVSSSLNRQR